MKRFTLLVLLFPMFLMAQKPGEGFSITGKLTGIAQNSIVTLTDFNNPSDTLSRTLVKKGGFVLMGTITEPNLVQVNFHDVQKKLLLFIGNETMTISGDINNLQSIQVKGSAIHDDFTSFQNSFNPLVARLSELNQKISSTPNLQRTDTLMINYFANLTSIKQTIDGFIDSKPLSPVTPFVILATSEFEQDITVLEGRFNKLNDGQKNGFYGKILSSNIADSRIGAVGSYAIPFIQNDTEGKPVSLSSFKGKYVLIDFWASWCGPCRMENPNVVYAFNRFKNKNFTILGVSLDQSKDKWLQAIKDDKLSWTQVSDLQYWRNEVAVKYRIQSIPQNFLVDPEGKIVAKNLRGSELQNKLCELLGCE